MPMEPGTPRWNTTSEFMAGVTLVLLSSWSAIVVFIVPAVTASHVRSQEQTSSECSIGGMS